MRDPFSELSPAVSFGFFAGVLLFSMFLTHPAFIAASFIASVSYVYCLRGMKGLRTVLGFVPVFVIVAAINPLFNIYGKTQLFSVFGRPYTLEALYYGLSNAGVFVSVMIWFMCYSDVMTSDRFTSLFAGLAPSLSLLLVMILRLVPSYIRKTKQITGTRRSLGLTPAESDGLREKLESGTVILSAMTSWALDSSVITADSMRARGYGAGKRTSFESVGFDGRDLACTAVMVLLLTAVTASTINGGGNASYTPDLYVPALTGLTLAGLAAYLLFMLIPTILHISEILIWHILRSKI